MSGSLNFSLFHHHIERGPDSSSAKSALLLATGMPAAKHKVTQQLFLFLMMEERR